MTKIVSINSDIVLTLRQYNINVDEAKLYLLGIYFNIDTQYISEKTRKQVNALNIVDREYSSVGRDAVSWNVPLFAEEKAEAFAWIEKWMDGFRRINPHRIGTKAAVMSRMKKFFAAHPEIRTEDVFKATEMYFATVSEPQYLKSSHKFIYEGAGFSLSSMLEQYTDQLKESKGLDGRSSKMKS